MKVWSERVLNVQMALMAPQKVPLVLSVQGVDPEQTNGRQTQIIVRLL